jgi:hypothetical protein
MTEEELTIPQVLDHIQRTTGCSRRTAMRKFRKAMADGKLQARWATDEEEKELAKNAKAR